MRLDRGEFDATHLIGHPQESHGILILDGLILAQLEAGRAHAAWLIGAGDLLRPWEMDQVSLIRGTRWQVLRPAKVLPLDVRIQQLARHDPRLFRDLLSRAARTSHWLFAKSLVISSPAIEERLMLLFALYGERWGKVTSEGIWIDLPLTHAVIGELCGARRPTVSVALRSLERQRVLTRSPRSGWLLRRSPDVNGHCSWWSPYAATLGPAMDDGASDRQDERVGPA